MGTKFPASKVKEQEVKAYREIGRQEMQKNLDKYLLLCLQSGVLVSSWTLVYTVVIQLQFILVEFVILRRKEQLLSTLINIDYVMTVICGNLAQGFKYY